MEGYKSGAITYSTKYYLIWAGKIVDTASHYNEFTKDGSARLDRYFENYGPGWFFYEAPLKIHPSIQPKMGASVALKRSNTFYALEGYYVNQGFWKQANFVSRLPLEIIGQTQLTREEPYFTRDAQGRVDCGSVGPRLAFKSMLDSGATYPTLHQEDLFNLGVDSLWYAAQTIQTFQAAAGPVTTRIYELYVCVLDNNCKQLVNSKDAVYPNSHKYLGSLCPVAQSPQPLQYDENGIEDGFRLSGILPFVACYMSSTPTRNLLFLGEDRNDVLGAHRMPGQKKWTIEMPPTEPAGGVPFDRYGNPNITFRHREGRIVDIDRTDKKHASTLIFLGGTAEEAIVQNDPGAVQISEKEGESVEREIEIYGLQGEDLEVSNPPLRSLDPNAGVQMLDRESHGPYM
jgi:hypothetical protein